MTTDLSSIHNYYQSLRMKKLEAVNAELLAVCKRLASTVESAGEEDDYQFLFAAIDRAEGRS